MKKIAHLTSVHPRHDTRIFYKQCVSLAKNGYDVSLIVADGLGDEVKDGVHIYDVGKAKGRLARMLKTTKLIYNKTLELDLNLVHLHDPELMPLIFRYKLSGIKVIYDSHEDLPTQIKNKPYLSFIVRHTLSYVISFFQAFAAYFCSGIVVSTPFIASKFIRFNKHTVDVCNYPILNELPHNSCKQVSNTICYIGGISKNRGIIEIVTAMGLLKQKSRLALVGNFSDMDLKNHVMTLKGWEYVDDLGYLDREGVRDTLQSSKVGLVTLLPLPNYLDSLPIKLFEYMSAGLPVVASNFPYWTDIVSKGGCGLCVDPKDPQAIANAIDYILTHREEAERMSKNGIKAVKKHNWLGEEEKLLDLYEKLL